MSSGVLTFGEGLGVLRASELGRLPHVSSLLVGTGGAEVNVASISTRLNTAVRTGAAACRHPGDWEGAAHRHELAPMGDAHDPVRR